MVGARLRNLLINIRASAPVMTVTAMLFRLSPAAHYIGNDTMLIRTIFGQKLYLDPRDQSVTPNLVLDGMWEKHVTRAYLRLLRPGATVVEIGANCGYFTTLAAERVGPGGRLHAFEANPGVADLLERSVGLNGQSSWCTVVRKAVCDRVGTVIFHCLLREQGNSSLREMEESILEKLGDDVSTIEVPCTTLDDYFRDTMPAIDLIKIDAEGAEPLILRGMTAVLAANPRLTILMEFAREMIAQTTSDVRGFLDELEGHGFRFLLIPLAGRLRRITADELMSISHCDVLLRRD